MSKPRFSIVTCPVGQMQANCYLLIDEFSQKTCIIDPGDDGDYIISILRDKKLNPSFIVATHGHFDHIMAVTQLQLTFQIPFYIHSKDEFLVHNMESSALHFLGIRSDPHSHSYAKIEKEKELILGNTKIKVLHTPGHTPGSVCLHVPSENILFCGDLIFAGGSWGRTDFSYSKEDELFASIQSILALSSGTILYPGHGESTNVKAEQKYYRVS